MLNYNPETKVISMIAKDTGDLVIALTNYVLTQGDKVYFTINNELEKEQPLVEKVITEFTENKAVIKLTSADTDLAPGTYLYDVQVNTVDGRVDTVLGPAKFKIAGGVRY